MGTLHWGGVGGGLAKPGSYIDTTTRGRSPFLGGLGFLATVCVFGGLLKTHKLFPAFSLLGNP